MFARQQWELCAAAPSCLLWAGSQYFHFMTIRESAASQKMCSSENFSAKMRTLFNWYIQQQRVLINSKKVAAFQCLICSYIFNSWVVQLVHEENYCWNPFCFKTLVSYVRYPSKHDASLIKVLLTWVLNRIWDFISCPNYTLICWRVLTCTDWSEALVASGEHGASHTEQHSYYSIISAFHSS